MKANKLQLHKAFVRWAVRKQQSDWRIASGYASPTDLVNANKSIKRF